MKPHKPDSKLLKQSIFILQTYIRLQKRYLEESVHVLLSFKREIFKGVHKDLCNHTFIFTSINFEDLSLPLASKRIL